MNKKIIIPKKSTELVTLLQSTFTFLPNPPNRFPLEPATIQKRKIQKNKRAGEK